jgi:hypothetical protein
LVTFLVQALMKLSAWQEAQHQIDAMSSYPQASWPFALRLLAAELPNALGHPGDTLQSLYALLEMCSVELISSEQESQRAMWSRRRRTVLFSLAARHVSVGQHRVALALVDDHLNRNPLDAVAWSQAVRVQAIAGDLQGARRSLVAAQRALRPAPSTDSVKDVEATSSSLELEKDAAMLLLLQGTKGVGQSGAIDALRAYASLAARHPENPSLSNNECVCHAYAGNVAGCRRMTEAAFKDHPLEMLCEPFVMNAATLLEAAPGGFGGSQAAKMALASWVSQAAPDDFDLACCKRPTGSVAGGLHGTSASPV